MSCLLLKLASLSPTSLASAYRVGDEFNSLHPQHKAYTNGQSMYQINVGWVDNGWMDEWSMARWMRGWRMDGL